MKIEQIKFKQEASKRVYNDYMKRVKKVTNSLSKESQDDIYMEINSHIFEAIQQSTEGNEIDALLDIIEKLGSPEEVLKPLVADKKLEQATTTFNPIHILKALALNFTNGFSYIIFFVSYLLLLGFVFLIFAKILHPNETGLFLKDGQFKVLGISSGTEQDGFTEVLGSWFIPAMFFITLFFYMLITFTLKVKKHLNKK
ncbi:HAAS signaling domain-containing protein [Pedobacter gandavensis]|uniref:DUF1700 domain-containing protein n=1 Tax=Pedobacter gandavensis TaxID=2679963 RepID=A0ABR6ES58_9SPHI|nr:hypothetical protein [Pedobacter gandavensis]MBB2148098.1 hypothetical protein [Pedobacter gandavensis]